MSNYNSLKATIDANIKQNGNQEITGQILNSVLNAMVTTLGTGYQFAGVATIATNPGTPDAKVFYIANGKGTYEKFGGLEVTEDEMVVLYWDSSWHKVATGIASQEKLSELEGEMGYSVQDLSLGYYMTPGVGQNVSPLIYNQGWHAMRIQVFSGQTFYLRTIGGLNGRAYAFTDENEKILEIADANATINGEIVAPQDGFLFVNYLEDVGTPFALLFNNITKEVEGVGQMQSKLFYKQGKVDGAFVSHGVIAQDGSFALTTNTAFDIYEYNVTPGQRLRIQTHRANGDGTGRAFAYAYYGNTPVTMIVSSVNLICDVEYVVPAGVNRICVYCNNAYPQSVILLTGDDVLHDISLLKSEVSNHESRIQTLENRGTAYKRTYTSDDFYVNPTTGSKSYYYELALNVGDIAPINPFAFSDGSTNWGCVKFEVKKGHKLSISTIGGLNGRAYAITDVDRKILVIAAAGTNTINNPFEYEVTEDGFCYVNCTTNDNPNFMVEVVTSLEMIVQGEEQLDKRVDALENEQSYSIAPKISNPPIDIRKGAMPQLRVLDIGNSFTDDSTAYLPGFVTSAGLDVSDMCLYRCIRGGGSFKSFYDSWHNQDTSGGTTDPTCHYSVGKLFGGLTQSISGTTNLEKMHSCFEDCKWDLIIIHQVSTYSNQFNLWNGNTDAGYLTELIRLVRLYQPQATIGFLMPHASYQQSLNGDTASLFRGIAESVQKMRSAYGIDFIIPVASAIENLRTSQTFKTMYPNVQKGYSRDGHHLGYGLARYVANAVCFQSILGKRYGVSVYGNTYRVSVTEQSTYPNENIDVTDTNATLAQICAILAYDQMYSINSPDNIESTL